MSKYKFTRKKDAFCWGNDDLMIIFRDPKITTYCDGPIHPEDIEFFDYSIEVYTRTFFEGKRAWEKFMDIFGEDLPIAEQCGDLITQAINIDAFEGQSETFENGNTVYSKKIDVASIDGDFWTVEKSVWDYSEDFAEKVGKDFEKLERQEYKIIFGEVKHQGFYFPVVIDFLDKKELLELKKTADAFYEFAVSRAEVIK